jgi:phosphate-selective porin OprO/OprP
LNWYLNENVRVLAGYERTYDLDDAAVTKLNGGDADDIDVFQLRAQWAI